MRREQDRAAVGRPSGLPALPHSREIHHPRTIDVDNEQLGLPGEIGVEGNPFAVGRPRWVLPSLGVGQAALSGSISVHDRDPAHA